LVNGLRRRRTELMRLIGKFKQGINEHEGNSQPKSKAQGMLEFALILPLLLVLIFGVIEVGRLLFIYAGIYTASREAARYGSAAGEVSGGTLQYMDCSGILGAAERVFFLNDITGINISYDAGPGTQTLSGGCPPNSNDIIGGRHRVIVEVTAEYQPLIPIVGISSFSLKSRSARTIFTNIEVARFPNNPAHIGGLTLEGVTGNWVPNVRVFVRDEEGTPVSNAIVSGTWYSRTGGDPICQIIQSGGTIPGGGTSLGCSSNTNIDGNCWTQKNIPSGHQRAAFLVTDVIHSDKAYDPIANIATCIDIQKP
jgi:hypothetical protein